MKFNHYTKMSGNNVLQELDKNFEEYVQKSLPLIKDGKLYLSDVIQEEYLKGYYIDIYGTEEGITTFYFKKDGSEDPLVIGEFVYDENQRQILMQQHEIYKNLPKAPAMSVLFIPFSLISCKSIEEMHKISNRVGWFEKLLGFILLTQYNVKNKIQ